MLHIQKRPEPRCLAAYRSGPLLSWDSVTGADKEAIREALLKEQGHLCAYCQRPIKNGNDTMKVEHWVARHGPDGNAALTFVWSNLLGVCTGQTEGVQHCDTARGNTKLHLHPVEGRGASPREALHYTHQGKVHSDNEDYEGDLLTLNLNAAPLKAGRKAALTRLSKSFGKQPLKSKQLRAKIHALRNALASGANAEAYTEVVCSHLQRWI